MAWKHVKDQKLDHLKVKADGEALRIETITEVKVTDVVTTEKKSYAVIAVLCNDQGINIEGKRIPLYAARCLPHKEVKKGGTTE